jgi:hypothetical protein
MGLVRQYASTVLLRLAVLRCQRVSVSAESVRLWTAQQAPGVRQFKGLGDGQVG